MTIITNEIYARALAECDRLRKLLAAADAAADAEMERVKACEHIAEGTEGWEVLRNLCPSTAAVSGLRDAYQAIAAAERERCAKIAERPTYNRVGRQYFPDHVTDVCREIAAAIRGGEGG